MGKQPVGAGVRFSVGTVIRPEWPEVFDERRPDIKGTGSLPVDYYIRKEVCEACRGVNGHHLCCVIGVRQAAELRMNPKRIELMNDLADQFYDPRPPAPDVEADQMADWYAKAYGADSVECRHWRMVAAACRGVTAAREQETFKTPARRKP